MVEDHPGCGLLFSTGSLVGPATKKHEPVRPCLTFELFDDRAYLIRTSAKKLITSLQSHGLHRLHPSQTNRVENVLRDASRPSAHLFSDRRVFISTISWAFSDLARMHGLPLLPGSPFCNHVRKENWSLYIGRKFWMSQTFLSFS